MKPICFVILLVLMSCQRAKTPAVSDTESVKDSVHFKFHKKLSFKNFSFLVSSVDSPMGVSFQELTIQPSGLINNDSIHLETDPVKDAVITDLDGNGFPELLIFTLNVGSSNSSSLIGYNVSKEKLLTPISLLHPSENPKIKEGFFGHEHFTVVAPHLVQDFPLYGPKDPNCCPTGGIRKVFYKLMGNAFVVDKIVDSPAPAK